MRLSDVLRDALGSLSARPLRSASMMLGVVIGVASLVTMLAIGSGAKARIEAQVAALGANLIMILPKKDGVNTAADERLVHPTLRDLETIAGAVAEVAVTAPALQGTARAVVGNRNRTLRLNGTTDAYFHIRDWPVTAGRVFSAREQDRAQKVAVIGRTAAEALFGDADPVGRQIRLLGATFEVIGVLAPKGQSAAGRDQDDILFLPYRTARLRLGAAGSGLTPDALSYAMAKAVSPDAVGAATAKIESVLGSRLRVVDPAVALEAQRNASRTVGLLLVIVALVSLVASGIGITNVMLASVSERRSEIGLRRAIGARARDIGRLFLAEGLLICLTGGALGALLGAVTTEVVSAMTGWPTRLSAEAALSALAFTSAVGIACSILPARRAARLSPVAAMRRT